MRRHILRILPVCLFLGCTAVLPRSANSLPAGSSVAVMDDAAPAGETPPSGNPRVSEKRAPAVMTSLVDDAARHLDAGDDDSARSCLEQYLRVHPDHAVIRAHLADLALKQRDHAAAKLHLDRYIEDAQLQGPPADRHMVHAHTRRVEVARAELDEYHEHLHRGIGLLVVARKAGDADDRFVEKTLFQAIEELKSAAASKPDEARPHWYLYEAWSELGQRHPAETALRRARALEPVGGLTKFEAREMSLAR